MKFREQYFSKRELREIGFRSLGERVLVARTCRIFSPETISLGNDVLISDFCILNGDITIGDHVDLNSNCELFTGENARIVLEDFAGFASFVSVYAQSDEYFGPVLHGPTIPAKFKKVTEGDVVVGKYAMIGTHSVVLPGVKIGEGCAFGAGCVINKSTEPAGLYVGSPAKRIRERDLAEMRRVAEALRAEERGRKGCR